MAVEKFGGAVDHNEAHVRRPAEHGAGKGVVHDWREAAPPAEGGHACQVGHPDKRVGDALHIEDLLERIVVSAERSALTCCLRAWSIS